MDWVEVALRGGSYAISVPLAFVVVHLFRKHSDLHAQFHSEIRAINERCARELAEVQAARVKEMERVTTAALALADTAEKIEAALSRRGR